MHLISGKTVSETVLRAYELIDNEGHKQETRNGYAKAVYDVTLEVTNPRSRHLCLEGRKSNIFQMIAETFWVMAGRSEIDPYLSFFLPRAKNYSDDGVNWHGAYGPRLYKYGQLQDIVRVFDEDGLDTRRAVLNIAMPEFDSREAYEGLYGEGHKAKDIPCNREIHFYVINNHFNIKVIQRSGDVLFGAGSINPFEFTFIQELIYNEVKLSYPSLKLGSYKWHVTNLHVYSEFEEQIIEALDSDINRDDCAIWESYYPLIAAGGVEDNKLFFEGLVAHFTAMIETDRIEEIVEIMNDIDVLLAGYQIPQEDNILIHYINVVRGYILAKKGFDVTVVDLDNMNYEFVRSVKNSSFRKFKIEV